MAVGAQQDVNLWPMAAQGADQAAHKAADLHPARPLAGPQQRGDKAALCVEHNDRLEAVIVVVGVEQAQLLAAMPAVEGLPESASPGLHGSIGLSYHPVCRHGRSGIRGS